MEKFMLEAALTALEAHKVEIDAQIEQVSRELGHRPARKERTASATAQVRVKTPVMSTTRRVDRVMSAEGRARIAAAQTKRWAKVRREKKAAEKLKEAKKADKKAAKVTKAVKAPKGPVAVAA